VDSLKGSLDHPVFFVIVMTVAVVCMAAIFSWGAKAAGLPGLAHLFKS